jgi:hypothetical protein
MARKVRVPRTDKPGKPERVHIGLFDKVLNDPNPVVSMGFAALLFFGPLYLLASYGFKGAGVIALAALLAIVFYRQQHGGLAFR